MSGQKIYPGRKPILFDGGLNNKFERSIIEDNESPDCLNVVFSNGSVATRDGFAKHNTAAIGSFVIDGLYVRRANDSTETMIAFAGGSAWALGGTSFTTIASAQSVFTAGVRVGASQFENHLFCGNGYVIPYKWNGTNWTRHGVYPPTTTHSVASQAVGVLTGDYRYKVTAVNSQSVESDVGPVSTTFTAAGATLRVSSIPTFAASFGISERRLYRTEAGGSTFKRVTTIADNTTTTYDDNNADSALGATAPTDNGVPPKYSVIIYHQRRLFMNDLANPSYVWYTGLDEPYTVASTNFFIAGDASADLVKGFGVYDNSLVIFCEKSAWINYMPSTSDSDWRRVRVKSSYGTKSPFCILDYNNKTLFPAMQNDKLAGFAALNGDTVDPSATLLTVSTAGSDLKSERIEPDVFNMQESYVGNFSGMVFKNKAYIAVTYGSGQTTNNRVYVMDFSISNIAKRQREAWVPWTGLNAAQFVIYAGNLYYGSSTATGFVYKLNSGVYSDDGTAINSYFWTKEFDGGSEDAEAHKDFRDARFLVEKAGDYFMTLGWRVDSDSGDGDTAQIDLDPGGSLWGSMVWGRDNWGGGVDQQEIRQPLAGARGQRIQFKFSNQNRVGQMFKVHWGKFSYNPKGRNR